MRALFWTRLGLGLLIVLELVIALGAVDAGAALREIQEALARGEQPHWEDVADRGIHLAALVNVGLLALLLLTAGKWLRPFMTTGPEAEPALPAPWWRRWLWPAAVLLLTLWYGSMSFAGKSLWWDELWQMKNASYGSWKAGEDGEAKFSATSWKRCAFYWQKPTNHVPMALAQKLSLKVMNPLLGAGATGEFSELAARLPALLASALAVVLCFRLLGQLGGVSGVSGLALLLLLHPWHLRYGVEARAYALLVPLCFSGLLAARAVVVSQARRWWSLCWLGLNQALWIWAFPFTVLSVAVLFGVGAWLLISEHRDCMGDRVTALWRWLAVHVAAGALVLQLFLPCALQRIYATEKDNAPLLLDGRLLKETLSQVAFGMEYQQADAAAPEAALLTSSAQVFGSGTAATLAIVLALGAALLGLRHLLRRLPRSGLIVICPLLGAVLFMVLAWSQGLFFYPRFVITLLPMFVVGLAELPVMLADYTQTRRKLALAILGLFALVTHSQRSVLRTVAYTPYREVAECLKQQPAPGPLVLCLGLGREALPLYFPAVRGVTTVAELEAAEKEAKAAGRPLLVVQAYTSFHRAKLPDAMRRLEDSGRYLVVREWPGLEANFFLRLWQVKP
jgi:hypothetical protein